MDFAYDKTRAIVILEKICQEAEINEVKWGFFAPLFFSG